MPQTLYSRTCDSAQAMPPKGAFTLERVQQFGDAAVEGALARLADDGGPRLDKLSCEYRGVVARNGEFDSATQITKRSTLAYEWHIECAGLGASCVVIVECGNADKQGAPFPKSWQTALRCLNLASVAEDAARAAREEIGGNIDCKLLGVAKRTTLPEPGEHQPGATVILAGDGTRMAHILCARVDGDYWLVHRGSFQDGALHESDPLNEHDLVASKLIRQAWVEVSQCSHRWSRTSPPWWETAHRRRGSERTCGTPSCAS